MRTAFNPIGVNFMSNVIFTGVIVSAILDYAPNGWLLCNGQTISKTKYKNLFEIIGYKFGGADDNFNVPDYRGLLLQMVSGNQQIGTKIEAGLPNITGRIPGFPIWGNVIHSNNGAFSNQEISDSFGAGTSGRNQYIISFDASKSNSIYGKSDTVQPPVSLINYFIKY